MLAGKGEYIWSPEKGNHNFEIKKYGKRHYLPLAQIKLCL